MLGTPGRGVVVLLPLLEGVEQSQVVRLGHEEPLPGGVALRFAVLGPEEDARDREHGDNHEDLSSAAALLGKDEHLGQRRIQGKLNHLAAEGRQGPRVVESTQDPELVERVHDVVLRRRVHEGEVQEVLHAEGLEQQHHVAEVCALDFGNLIREELVAVLPLSEKAIGPARARATSTASALVGIGLGLRSDLKGVHADLGVVDLELAEARVHDVLDPVHGE
mmetsp:Transcript_12018/g.34743  ORF Transcript_12018/g.34743 Transcript_12018/m.34743 type:complete len:221 (-) Transcript_12018:630-1292(-)